MSLQLRIRMFGPFTVWREGNTRHTLDELRAHKMASHLLALLLLYPNRSLSKTEMTTLFWGEGETEDKLNKTISLLCASLGGDGARLTSVSRTVRFTPDALPGLEPVAVDLHAFERAWAQREQDTQPLQAAIEACDGPLLQGWDEPWVEQARDRVAEKVRQALHLLVHNATAQLQFETAQHYLNRLREQGDCAEQLHIQLMDALMQAGAYPSARQSYEEYREYLRREHSLYPPARMTAMVERIPRVATDFDPPVEAHQVEAEAPGGTLQLSSRLYIERAVDRDFHTALARRDGTILINGPRQVGKSSLLARGAEQARQTGWRVVLTDFQKLDTESLQSHDGLFRCLARAFQRKLALDRRPDDYWDVRLSPNENFDGYLLDVVLPALSVPLVWCIDEADRIFDRDYRGSAFGLFRSWHTARSEEPDSPWNRFLLVMAYSSEARLFIPNLHQSPFNVGTRVTLEDFTPDEVQELNVRHGSPLNTNAEVVRLHTLVGGHPYLMRLCLHEMTCHALTVAALEQEAEADMTLFRDHLERLYEAISVDVELCEGVRALLRGDAGLTRMAFIRLRSAGVVMGKSASAARLRCRLYESYFKRHLL
jgi:DNA-binding SARP family transcriptional activator